MNLTRYTRAGADLTIFSGGKYIAGPNNSGILTGRADLIKLAHLQAYPFHGVGRASKMSRETIVGLITALNLYLQEDEEQKYAQWQAKAEWIKEQLTGVPGVEPGIDHQATVEEDHPMVPLCYIKLDQRATRITGGDLATRLRDGDPSIETLYEPGFLLKDPKGKLVINPEFLQPGEAETAIKEIKPILRKAKK